MERQVDTHHDEERVPELTDLELPDKPDGPGAAAMLAAGIGLFALGLFTVLAEASEGIKGFFEGFEMDRGVGPLAGKTTLAVVAWLVAWVILALAWRGKDVSLRIWFWVGLLLGVPGSARDVPSDLPVVRGRMSRP
jgi:hypothetical protein